MSSLLARLVSASEYGDTGWPGQLAAFSALNPVSRRVSKATMALTFYYWPRSSATRVHWALEELGLPYEKKRLRRDEGENRTPTFLAISPMGSVPALVDDGVPIFESLAILIHLGERYGIEKGLWPKLGTPQAGEALSWTVWSTGELGPVRTQVMLHTMESPYSLPKELRSPAIADWNKKNYYQRMTVLGRRLEGREWLVGDGFSFADLASSLWVNSAQTMFGLSLADYPNVAAWAVRCTSRPAFKRVMQET
jgi:glutathione S-transferase